ncbi:MAG TPA: M15 family metallopeptidase, partial [Candidatus Aminicenantes bacterium]|nr:M15 family metallopeptidase [Candidatus Aminicenantes bacterium]
MSSRKYRGAALSLPLLFSLLLSLSCTHARKSAPSQFPPPGLHVVVDVQEYRAQVAADPEMELVDLQRVIPGLPLDIRYATKNNFTGEVIYTEPKAYLRKPVAE